MSLPTSVKRWAFYDFANSSYVLIYSAYLLPIFFTTVLVQYGYTLSSWGWAAGISTVVGVVSAVIIGKAADQYSRYRVCRIAILLAFTGMVAVAFSVQYFVEYLYVLFIITNSIYILTISLSDSILPFVSNKRDAYYHSGFAWGFGYMGGMISLIIVLLLQRFTSEYSSIVFLSVALFYLLFSWYSLDGLKNVQLNDPASLLTESILTPRDKSVMFLGYWLISEGITVILLFFTIYGTQELKISPMIMGGVLFCVQLIAFPATWYGGYLAKYYNPLSLLGITIILWGITIAFLIAPASFWALIAIVIFGGLTLGNSQSFLRAQYSTLIHKSQAGFQFGIYSLVSQASVFIGPIVYGYASDVLGSQKLPLIALFILMAIGYGLLCSVIKKHSDTHNWVQEV